MRLNRPLALTPLALTALLAGPQAPHRTTWELANYTWVKLVPREAGSAPNAHPATLSAEVLGRLLEGVTVKLEGGEEPLFERGELSALQKVLAEAFAVADPGEDAVLLSAHRRGGGFLSPQLGATARLFVSEGRLNLIVHDARLDFMGRVMAERIKPTFHYGTRTQASALALASPLGTSLRPDWIAFPMPLAAPTATPAPAPAAAPAAAPAPAKTEAWYREREEKLRSLKRLRDEKLITEGEYEQKRQEILKDY